MRLIGIGGYAQVFEARTEGGERVALKVLRIRHARDRRAADRLFKEATIIRSHNHVNIVAFRDWGIYGDDEFVYLAMELVNGKTLSAILRDDGAVPVQRALKWGRQLCYALVDVHRNNVVHRDIKPSNIMVVAKSNDLIKLLDFGVARDEMGLGTTQAVGTPLYMSPDYLRDGPSKPDPRWDVYAVAMVLYQCLTGSHPLVVKDEEQPSGAVYVTRQLSWQIPPLGEVVDCPDFVSETIMKGLEKNPGRSLAHRQGLRRGARRLCAAQRTRRRTDDQGSRQPRRERDLRRRSHAARQRELITAGTSRPSPRTLLPSVYG